MYAVVDIETTGGYASGNGITEIAIFLTDGKKVTDSFESLVNPECYIPGFITSLTGITNEMVQDAPTFAELAEEIENFTKDRIFVAHNVNFDYSFVKQEFSALGLKFERKKLCTVRLSRKIVPNLPSYSLGNLCGSLGIKIENRHRAKGDAEATTKLLHLLIKADNENFIDKSLKRSSRETLLPAHLPKEDFEALPEEAGVYYFHDSKGKVIYVGKAINIKKRVVSHFSGKSHSRQSQSFMNEIYGISFELCGNELVALLHESHEIKKYWPAYNWSQKRAAKNVGIYHYEDRQGYIRLDIGTVSNQQEPLISFRYVQDARDFLTNKISEYKLCPKLCGLYKAPKECADHKIGECNGACINEENADEYNARVNDAISSFMYDSKTFVLKGKGRSKDEHSIVVVERGKYLGYGFIDKGTQINEFDELKSYVNGHRDNQDIQKILSSYLKTNSSSLIHF